MRILTHSTALAAVLLTASALPVSTPFPFFTLKGLPECAKTCKNILNANLYCWPPTAPVSNEATYVACFCQSRWLYGVKDGTGICQQDCSEKDEKEIQATYDDLCGIPHPSATRFLSVPAPTTSRTSTSEPSASISILLTTSKITLAPIPTFFSPATDLQRQPDDRKSWHVHTDFFVDVLPLTLNRTSEHLVAVIVIPFAGLAMLLIVWLLFVQWYSTTKGIGHWYSSCRLRTRARKRDPSHQEVLLANHQKWLENCQRRAPVTILDNSRTARLWRWLKGGKARSTDDENIIELQDMNTTLQSKFGVEYNPRKNRFVVERGSRIPGIKDHRTRFTREQWLRTNESFAQHQTSRNVRRYKLSRRSSSSRTEASSVDQCSVYSPLDSPWRTIVPPLPVRSSTPRTPQTPQSPQSPTIPLPTVYKSPTAGVSLGNSARASRSSNVSDAWRSHSSPQSPSSPSDDVGLILPAQSFCSFARD